MNNIPINQLTKKAFYNSNNSNYIQLPYNSLVEGKFYYMYTSYVHETDGVIMKDRYFGGMWKKDPNALEFICYYKYNTLTNEWEEFAPGENLLKIDKSEVVDGRYKFYTETTSQPSGGKRKIRKTRRAKKSKRHTRRH
jgi:hypothetical protein